MPRFATEVVSQPVLDFLRSKDLSQMVSALTKIVNNSSQLASETQYGDVKLAASGSSNPGRVVQSTDSRLSDARTPTAHSTTHRQGGSDPLKLDDLAAPDDNTDLNATTLLHGLMSKADKSKLDLYPATPTFNLYAMNGVPGVGVGVDGDFVINRVSLIMYEKVAGAWTILGRLCSAVGEILSYLADDLLYLGDELTYAE